jgi:hypothetical protein
LRVRIEITRRNLSRKRINRVIVVNNALEFFFRISSLEKLYEIYDLICEKEDGILEERMRKRQARQAKVDSPGEILYRTFKKYSDLKKDKRKFQ